MRREYDLINELGPQNWLDVLAGEAVILGQLTHDPELTMRGTKLAAKLREVDFFDDDFSKVEADAVNLLRIIDGKKDKQESCLFLDEICEYDGKEKSLTKWEYDLVLIKGEYQILLIMPMYFGSTPSDDYLPIEKVIQESFIEPSFDKFVKVEESKMMGCQKMDTTDYYTNDGRTVCHKVDFNHECGWKRGMFISYFIDKTSQALEAWMDVRAIISDRKK